MDRIFYVYADLSGYRYLMLRNNTDGGVGRYLWEDSATLASETLPAMAKFAALYTHYCVNGSITPLTPGIIPPP